MPGWAHLAITFASELAVLLFAIYAVHRAQKQRIYRAFWQLLVFMVSMETVYLLDALARGANLVNSRQAYEIYFYTYWPAFLIEGILMLRVLHEMFRHAIRSIPGVQKLGQPLFFWAIAVSIILAVASGTSTAHNGSISLLLSCAQVLMRSESVLALCMLTFLAFASHTLGVSFRSRIFGVVFGFGMMAVSDLLITALFVRHAQLASLGNIVHEGIYLSAILLWAGYFLQPEPARKLVSIPVTSPLMRWNDIAQTLGNSAGQVAVSYPPSFMNDVFHLVNHVMGPMDSPNAASASNPPGPMAG